jgi:AAA ATPase domain
MAGRPRSPYRPGMGTDPPYLGDREPQLQRFREYLAEPGVPHNMLVTGLRGVGKTVLLNHYRDEAEHAGWLVVDREWAEADAEPLAFARLLLADLQHLARRLSLSERVRGVAGDLAGRVLDLVSGLSVSYEGVELSYRQGTRRGPPSRLDDDLRRALLELGELCERSEQPGFVLRYDEFHVIEEKAGELTLSALLAAIAAVQQRGSPVLLVLCGLPPILENLARAKSYSERMFTLEHLGNLRPPEDRAALVDPARALGREYEEAAVAAILQQTAGYPYFLQLYGDLLWRGTAGATITLADFERLRPEIESVLDRGFYESRYLRTTPRERAVLHAIAQQGEQASVRQIQAASGLANNVLQPTLASLVRKGLVYRPARGLVAFSAPLFGAYLRRRGDDAVG